MTAEDIYQIAKELPQSEKERLASMLIKPRPKRVSQEQERRTEIRKLIIQKGILHPPA